MNTSTFTIDERSLRKCYRDLESDINTHYMTSPDGEPLVIVEDHWTYFQMEPIDVFVRNVLASNTPAFTLTKNAAGRYVYRSEELARKYFRTISGAIGVGLLERFTVRNVFVDLFVTACDELKILTWQTYTCSRQGRISDRNAECFNELVEKIRHLAKQPLFRSRIRHAKSDLIRNYSSCERYVRYLFAKKGGSRHMVLRLDLGYRKEYAFDVFTADAKADLKRLLNHRRRNKRLFGDLAGYIWKIEYGAERLLHFHVVLFFTGKNASKHGYWAQQVGLYWQNVITKGRGTFHNCNYHQSEYKKWGIGEVNRSDTVKIGNLLGAIGYFFKTEQCIPIQKSDPQYRTFGKGEEFRD